MGSKNTPQNYLAKSGALWENNFRVYTRAEGHYARRFSRCQGRYRTDIPDLTGLSLSDLEEVRPSSLRRALRRIVPKTKTRPIRWSGPGKYLSEVLQWEHLMVGPAGSLHGLCPCGWCWRHCPARCVGEEWSVTPGDPGLALCQRKQTSRAGGRWPSGWQTDGCLALSARERRRGTAEYVP